VALLGLTGCQLLGSVGAGRALCCSSDSDLVAPAAAVAQSGAGMPGVGGTQVSWRSLGAAGGSGAFELDGGVGPAGGAFIEGMVIRTVPAVHPPSTPLTTDHRAQQHATPTHII
jgi:hypothetical protein